MLTKEAFENMNNNSSKYSDKNGNIVDVPNEWWETEEGKRKLEDLGITREDIIMF